MRPRILQLTAPPGREVYEIHLSVKSKIGVLREITGFLAKANVDILSMHIQASQGRTADIIAFIELGDSRESIERLLREVRDLDFVLEADAVKKEGVIFEEFLFPIMVEDDVRGFLMTDSAWISIATRLVLTYGTGGLAILHEAGAACGEEYAKQLQAKLGARASAGAAIENLRAMLRTAGFGLTEIERTPEGLSVRVREPIIKATETKIHDHFLTGLIAGAAGQLFASSFTVEKVRFEGSELGFLLSTKRAAPAAKDAPLARAEGAR